MERSAVTSSTKMSKRWREEQDHFLSEIAKHEAAEQSYMDEGVRLLELAQNAQALFERQTAREKRRLLNFLLSNCTWQDGTVVVKLRQPFDLIMETAVCAERAAPAGTGKSPEKEIWLGDLDSNQDWRSQSPLSYR